MKTKSLYSIAARFCSWAAVLGLLVGDLEARTWKNNAGTEIEAELTGIENGVALLVKDGRTFRVPVATLSAADQEFLQTWKPTAVASASAAESKKGLCLGYRQVPDWALRLQTLKAGWFYSWTAEAPDQMPAGVEFVPMVFGKPQQIDRNVAYVTSSKTTVGFQYLLGFNEPDKQDQSNMTVEAALAAWPKLMSADLPLISPAAANPEGEWMEQFMKGVKERGYRVDFIAIHSYGGTNAEAFLDKLERVHKKFDRPLWITEFAVADWAANDVSENKFSAKSIKDFMKKVLPKLDRLKYVHRYAWFSSVPSDPHLGTSALFNADGSMTELGEAYAKP